MEEDCIGSIIFFCEEGFVLRTLYLAKCHFAKRIHKFVSIKFSVSVDPRSQTENAEVSPE